MIWKWYEYCSYVHMFCLDGTMTRHDYFLFFIYYRIKCWNFSNLLSQSIRENVCLCCIRCVSRKEMNCSPAFKFLKTTATVHFHGNWWPFSRRNSSSEFDLWTDVLRMEIWNDFSPFHFTSPYCLYCLFLFFLKYVITFTYSGLFTLD